MTDDTTPYITVDGKPYTHDEWNCDLRMMGPLRKATVAKMDVIWIAPPPPGVTRGMVEAVIDGQTVTMTLAEWQAREGQP